MGWLRYAHGACFVCYMALAWYVQWRAPRRVVSATVAAMAVALAIWSGALVFAHDPASPYAVAAFAYRLGAIAWSGIGSLSVVTALAVTGQLDTLRRRSVRLLLIVPPSLVLASQWAGLTDAGHVKYVWGWSYVWSSSIATWAFYTYYATYVGAALLIVRAHARRTREPLIRRHGSIIAVTGTIALIAATLTDVVFPRVGYHAIPNVAPLILIVFLAGVVIAVVRYRILELTPENASAAILASMRDGVMLVDRDGRVLEYNRAADELLGERNLTQRALVDVVGREAHDGEPFVLSAGARELSVEVTRVSDPAGAALGSICVVRDLTDQKRNEAALRQATEVLEVRVAQRTRELDTANHALARSLALREALHALVDSVHRADSAHAIGNGVARSLNGALELPGACRIHLGTDVFVSDRFVEDASAATYPIEVSAMQRGRLELHGVGRALREDEHQTLARVVAEVGQALEGLALRTSIAQADRLASIGILAAGVAHEINNPLTYLSLGLERLARSLRETSSPRELLALVEQSIEGSQRIAKVVRELGAFARDADEVAPVSVRAAAEAAIEIVAHQVTHRARLDVDLETRAVVRGDAGRLTQVFVNLLVNAAQAIPEGSGASHAITITGRDRDDETIVSVTDTGIGIPASAIGRIFDPFFTTKGIGQGTGLGLAISYKIVRAFGGTISVSSSEGAGACFEVRLPRVSSLFPRTITPPPFSRSRGHRVLVIDDDVLVAHALADFLRAHHVRCATSAVEARDLLERGEHFDIVFCDLMMPEMGGAELYAWVLVHVPQLAERFVFVSGGAFSPEARAFVAQHSDRILAKPFDEDLVEVTLERVIRGT